MTLFDTPQSPAFARLAGSLYLIIAVAGGYAILYVPGALLQPGDPMQTFANIATHRGFYLSGLLGNVVMMLTEIALTAMLFYMFRPVQPVLSLMAALARFAMVSVMATMLFFHAAALHFVDPNAALASFDMAQRTELAGAFLHIHDAGVWVWQIFFAAHLVILGHLIARSGVFPRLLGLGMSIGGFGYVLDTLSNFAFPDVDWLASATVAFLIIVTLAELGFALWLVIVGPRSPATDTGWQQSA